MKKKNTNWFEQNQKSNNPKEATQKKASASKVIEVKSPILSVLEKSKKEDLHYREALAFAYKHSNAKNDILHTVHLTMQDTLVFDIPKDAAYEKLWRQHELALLVSFPANWKSISLAGISKALQIDPESDDLFEDADFDEWDHLEADERFDLLYETGLRIYEK